MDALLRRAPHGLVDLHNTLQRPSLLDVNGPHAPVAQRKYLANGRVVDPRQLHNLSHPTIRTDQVEHLQNLRQGDFGEHGQGRLARAK